MYTLGVLTVSDLGYQGKREDLSGKVIREILEPRDFVTRRRGLVPDERLAIETFLRQWSEEDRLDLVITTGGTGFGPRDLTPEATLAVVDRLAPGLTEAMRAQTSVLAFSAVLSRAVAGIHMQTLIINLPGSPSGVRECLEVVIPVLSHALDTIQGRESGHPHEP